MSTSAPLGLGLFESVPGKTGGVGSDFRGHDRRAGSLAPDFELLDCRGAECVARRQHDRKPALAELGGKLADRRRLAGAVDADDEDDVRLVRQIEFERPRDGREHLLHLLRHDRAHFRLGHVLAVARGGQRVGDAQRRLHAEVGADQHVLKFFQRRIVELALGEDAGNRPGQFARGPRQALAQPLEPALARFRRRPRGPLLGLLFDQLADGDFAGGTRSGNRGRCGRRRGGGRHRRYERRMVPASREKGGRCVRRFRDFDRCGTKLGQRLASLGRRRVRFDGLRR